MNSVLISGEGSALPYPTSRRAPISLIWRRRKLHNPALEQANLKKWGKFFNDRKKELWTQQEVRGRNKPYKFSLETTSVLEARRKRDEYLLDIAVNGKITEREPSVIEQIDDAVFGEVAVKWAEIRGLNLSKSTTEEYRKDMNRIILPKFGNRPISLITAIEIEEFIQKLKCSGKRKVNILTPFRNVMKFAKKHKLITENPMDNMDGIKTETSEKYPLSNDQIPIFLKTVPVFYKPLFVFSFFSGVRFGEAAALKWKRVNFKDGKVHIRKTFVRSEYKDPKTKGSIRYVKLHPVAIEALQLQKKHTFSKSEFIFLNKFGRNIHEHSVNIHVFKPTLQKAEISTEKRSCKDTRSSYITNSIDNNKRISFVQKQVGHKNNKMIIQHYYNHIPADDGKGLENAFTMELSGEEIKLKYHSESK